MLSHADLTARHKRFPHRRNTQGKGNALKRIQLLLAIAAAAVLALGGANAFAGKPGDDPCSTGTLASGSYDGFTVTGTCNVGFLANVTVNGNVTVAPGAVLMGLIPSTVHIAGNVLVGEGGIFGLGYATRSDVVDGNIVANQPLSLYLGNVTVHGNVVSNGGGTGLHDFRNFPLKENQIDGNLVVHGWQGGWFGILRNHIDGNVDLSGIGSIVHLVPDGCENDCTVAPGGDPDSTEVADNVVGGNLICQNNSPAAQFGDSGGGPNTVAGRAVGECAALVSS